MQKKKLSIINLITNKNVSKKPTELNCSTQLYIKITHKQKSMYG